MVRIKRWCQETLTMNHIIKIMTERMIAMEVTQLCEELFCRTGQIGYYLLGCCLAQEEEEQNSGALSACQRHCAAQQGL